MRQLCLSALLVIAMGLSAATARAVEFAPHRALYELTLAHAQSGSGISGVAGELVVEWRNACPGWTFEYRSVIDVIFAERGPLRLASTASTWESSDGRSYRFSVRHQANGQDTDRIEGAAKVGGPGQTGQVEFSKPKQKTVTLPAGTLFPIAHTLAILEVAAADKAPVFVSRAVFDGMDESGLYQVNAAIGRAHKEGGSRLPLLGLLKKEKSWPVDLAYFSYRSTKAEPDHEIKMRLYANGVADDMLLDFENFTIRAQIGRLEPLVDASCP